MATQQPPGQIITRVARSSVAHGGKTHLDHMQPCLQLLSRQCPLVPFVNAPKYRLQRTAAVPSVEQRSSTAGRYDFAREIRYPPSRQPRVQLRVHESTALSTMSSIYNTTESPNQVSPSLVFSTGFRTGNIVLPTTEHNLGNHSPPALGNRENAPILRKIDSGTVRSCHALMRDT